MSNLDPVSRRDQENPDPHELNRPVPKVLLALVAMLLAWAIYYIASQAPGLESSSTPRAESGQAGASGSKNE